jgi:hypothetical protein
VERKDCSYEHRNRNQCPSRRVIFEGGCPGGKNMTNRKKGGGVIRKLWRAELVTVALQRVVMQYWSRGKILWKYNRNRRP